MLRRAVRAEPLLSPNNRRILSLLLRCRLLLQVLHDCFQLLTLLLLRGTCFALLQSSAGPLLRLLLLLFQQNALSSVKNHGGFLAELQPRVGQARCFARSRRARNQRSVAGLRLKSLTCVKVRGRHGHRASDATRSEGTAPPVLEAIYTTGCHGHAGTSHWADIAQYGL